MKLKKQHLDLIDRLLRQEHLRATHQIDAIQLVEATDGNKSIIKGHLRSHKQMIENILECLENNKSKIYELEMLPRLPQMEDTRTEQHSRSTRDQGVHKMPNHAEGRKVSASSQIQNS